MTHGGLNSMLKCTCMHAMHIGGEMETHVGMVITR
jgi:hypothetical protein